MAKTYLHMKIDAKFDHIPQEIQGPIISVPITDPVGTALELGLDLIPDRAADGHPEVVAKGVVKLPVTKVFGRQISFSEGYEIDTEVWIATEDDAAIAAVDNHIAASAS